MKTPEQWLVELFPRGSVFESGQDKFRLYFIGKIQAIQKDAAESTVQELERITTEVFPEEPKP